MKRTTQTDQNNTKIINLTDPTNPQDAATKAYTDLKVTGPGSSTDNAIARFDGTTGKLIQNSTAVLSDVGAITLGVTDNTTALILANNPTTGAESLGNEILFKPGGLGGTNIWGYGIISWYAEDYTRKDCILQVHRANYITDSTVDHRHFSIYTSIADRSSTVKRFNIPYMYDIAPITFQNSTVEIQSTNPTGNAFMVNHNPSSASGTSILAQFTNGPTNPSTSSVIGISQYGVGAAIGITHQSPTTQTSASIDILGKFGYKHTLNASGGYCLNVATNGTNTVSTSNGLARIAALTTADTSPVLNIDNRSSGKTIYIQNNGTELLSISSAGVITLGTDTTLYRSAADTLKTDDSLIVTGTLTAGTYTGQSSIVTLGTITTGTWSATTVAVNKGGTGQTSYTDGQLLIGNSTGNTLDKATLTAGNGISITNAGGSITVANSSGYTVQGAAAATSPNDATTYYIGSRFGNTLATSAVANRIYIPRAGKIKACYAFFFNGTSNGSNEASTISIRLNNTTDTTVSTAVDNSATSNVFSKTDLDITVAAGDYIELKWVTPTWATNPVGTNVSFVVYITPTS